MSNKYILAGKVLEILAGNLWDMVCGDFTIKNTRDNMKFMTNMYKENNDPEDEITLSKYGDYIYTQEGEVASYCAELLKEAGSIIAKMQEEKETSNERK